MTDGYFLPDTFYCIRDWALEVAWNKNPDPLHVFVTGGAGTGKSHLIKCIYHEVTRILSKALDSPDAVSVLLTAPTGTAAFNIGGVTVHSAFAINKNIKLPYTPLGENILNTLRKSYESLHLLIVDEISMVPHKLLTYIHGRLCQLKHSKKPFGNVSVIAVGDFYQLPPVRASPLYKVLDSAIFDLWNPLFSIVTLTQVMRQKEDAQFAAMLNRLRVHTKHDPLFAEDCELLNSASINQVSDVIKNVLHIYATNKEVTEHNSVMVQAVCNPCISSVAKDYYRSTVNGGICQREQPYSTSPSEGLPDAIQIGIGARVMLIRNIDTDDGLVNGAFGSVTAIEQLPNADVKAVYVKFDHPSAGKNLRSKTSSKILGSEGAVRIIPIEETISYKNATRKQLPLKLGWAATIHKVQGMTAKEIVVSLKNIFQPGMAYVALSRATSLQGLHIINLDTTAIYASEEIRHCLEDMPQFLKEKNHPDANEHSFMVVLHNTEGIIPHKDDIENASFFTKADVICFTETWLNKNMNIPISLLPDFQVHTLHRESAYSSLLPCFQQIQSMTHGGVATFVNGNILHSRKYLSLGNLEYVMIQVHGPKPITIINIYRPPTYPKNIFCEKLQELLSSITNEVDTPVIIVGDLNDNFLATTPAFTHILENNGFQQLVTQSTTESGTCLDVIVTNMPSADLKSFCTTTILQFP